jgi:hypothetical protein
VGDVVFEFKGVKRVVDLFDFPIKVYARPESIRHLAKELARVADEQEAKGTIAGWALLCPMDLVSRGIGPVLDWDDPCPPTLRAKASGE